MLNLASADSNPALRLFLLGTFRVSVGTQVIDHAKWRRRKASALLKILALAPAHHLHREQIIDLLWPNARPEDGANNFHQALYLARHVLDPKNTRSQHWLRLEDDFLSLSSDGPVWVDVEAFEATAAEARRSDDPVLYRRALELYSGELLPEDRYADWASARRESLRQEYLALLMGLAETYRALQQYQTAIDTLKQVVASEPAHEEAHRALMELYSLMGKREQALAQFAILREALRKDLDAEPDAASQQLHQRILAGDVRSLEAASPLPLNNLPIQLTSFIGREQEISAVRHILNTTRLLTLTGPGGCGKTRLALEVVREQADLFASGVWFVDFAPLSDPAFVARAVANVLGVQEVTGWSVTDTLAAFLKTKHILVLLDNCEHLSEACAQLCDALLHSCLNLTILATSREPLHVVGEIVWLVPSLSLPDPDQLPALQDLLGYSATRLFVERARAVVASFDLNSSNAAAVARLCFHLDGIPLAIELAAARVNVLSVEQILARLDDRFRLLTQGSRTALNRQQTLQAAIDWSYDLLSAPERVLFQRLTVFAGGWTVEAAESVTSDEVPNDRTVSLSSSQILDLLARLVDKSLILVAQHDGESHFRMLETIREYARQRLGESGEAPVVMAQHCAWCIAFLEQANPRFWGSDHMRWVRRLEDERDNMRAALAWCAEHDPQSGLRLAILLEQFWVLRGYFREALTWLHSLLLRASEPTALRAKALLSQFLLQARSGGYQGKFENLVEGILAICDRLEDKADQVRTYHIVAGLTLLHTGSEKARPFFESSLMLARDSGFEVGVACAEHFLGVQACAVGDYARAETLIEQSISRFRELGTESDIAPLFLNICQMPFTYGVHRQWRIVDEESFVLIRHIGANSAVGYALANWGSVARAQHDHSRAIALYEASRAHFTEIADQSGLSQVIGQMGYMFVTLRDEARARTLWEASLVLRRELGDRRGIGRSLNNLANAATLSGDYAQARAWLDESLELFQEMRDKPGVAQTFNHLGNWAMEQDDFVLAESFYGKSLSLFGEFTKRGAGYLLLNLAECARGAGNESLARTRLEQARVALETYGNRRVSAAIAEQLKVLENAGHRQWK